MTDANKNNLTYGASKNGNRIAWIDFARALAILMVIVCHSTEAIYSFTVKDVSSMGLISQISAFVLFAIGRLGVPLFLFISGYLMLDRQYDKQACIKFWKQKWTGLLIATEIWIVIYNIFLCCVNQVPFDFALLLKNVLFLERVGMGHMWYMPMILGLYLFLPFIANGLKWLNDARLLIFPLCIVICILFVVPVIDIVAESLGFEGFASLIDSGFSGGVYGCYMLLGYFVKRSNQLFKNRIMFLGGGFHFC